MRFVCLVLLSISAVLGQQTVRTPAVPEVGANLPAQSVGPNDLIAVSVYDAPELSRTIRVGGDGYIRLPMLKRRVKAEGLYPADLEAAITRALQEEEILVNPFVTVTIAELPIAVRSASPVRLSCPWYFRQRGPPRFWRLSPGLRACAKMLAGRSLSVARNQDRTESRSR